MFQSESETTPNKSDITEPAEDHSREFHKVTHSIEEVEPAEMTDQESSEEEEETLETSPMNLTEINTKNQSKSLLLLQSNKQPKSLKNKNNLRNQKS